MGDEESSASNAKKLYGSYPYPVTLARLTAENRRDEATRSNVDTGPPQIRSPHIRDQVLRQGHWNNEARYFQHPCTPSAPYMDGNFDDEPIAEFLPIRYNDAENRTSIAPYGPPPSYDELHAQKNRDNTKFTEGRISNRRSANAPSSNFSSEHVEVEPSTGRRTSVISASGDDSMHRNSLENQYICLNVCRMIFYFTVAGFLAGAASYYIFWRW